MNWITLGVFLLGLTLVIADIGEKKSSGSTKLDPVLRKALLKALSNLENESETTEEEDNTTVENETETTRVNEVLEESTRRDETNIRVHSFLIDASNQTDTSDSGEEIIKTIIIKKPRTTLTPPYKDSQWTLPDPIKDTDNDIEIDSVQQARSVATSVSANEIPNERPAATTTLSTTTVSTTPAPPAPVTNADGENIEKVKEGDVKIFQAPLVAAFTVQQDQHGTPKHVIPHFKNTNEIKSAKPVSSFKRDELVASATTVRPSTETSRLEAQSSSGFFTTQRNDVNDQFLVLEQKNRQLEQQIALLQAQQRQQQEFLRQQQIFSEQQNFQRQQQLFFEQQQRLHQQQTQQQQSLQQQQNQQNQQQQHQHTQQQQQQQQSQQSQQQNQQRSNVIQLIPSVQLPTQTVPISVQQALPFKEHSEFGRSDFSNNNNHNNNFNRFSFQNFNAFQTPAVTIQKSKEPDLRPPTFQSSKFQSFNTFPQSPSTNLIAPPIPEGRDKNRVFRNDASQTGNFGANVQVQPSVAVNFRPSQPFNGFPNVIGEHNIHNLLLRSGVALSPRSAEEDFNIISKVLALNHGIQPSQTNNLGLGFNERRFR